MRRTDRGQLAGAEVIPFGLLIFVVGALLIANAWAVVDAKFAVDAAALAAARSFAETPPAHSHDAAVRRATAAGGDALEAHGRDPTKLRFEVVSDHGGPDSAPIERCTSGRFEAHYTVPAITLPFIGGFGDGFDVQATHERIVDPLRSGLSGEASCL